MKWKKELATDYITTNMNHLNCKIFSHISLLSKENFTVLHIQP